MKLRVQQVRKGFAFNSSSSHSIVFLKPGDVDTEAHDRGADDYYGWEEFILATPEAKAKYFAAQFRHALASSVGEQAATVVTSGYFGDPGLAGIDHQSVLSLPRFKDGSLATEFIRDIFTSFIKNDAVGVIGGNDNGGDSLVEGRPDVFFPSSYKGMLARKEADGTWTTFDTGSGNKVRFTPDFLGNMRNRKSLTPELVDIKITDYCSFGCTFCYQGSTLKGKHASLASYKKLIDKLAELQVFEVAIGGGEPTEHPDFLEMLQYAAEKKVVPNFTTRSTSWKHFKDIKDIVGGIGVSCDSLRDMQAKAKKFKEIGRATYQFIAGVTPQEELEKISAHAAKEWLSLSLVGFKRTGRAGEPLPLDGDKLKKVLSEHIRELSVDITFLQQYPMFDQIATCDTEEGRHSMYVDLVTKEMAKSSYCPERAPLKLDGLNEYFLSI